MALNNYSALRSAVQDWMARSDLSGNVADWITLGEARLNRLLPAVEVDQALIGTPNSRRIDVSSYAIVVPIALFAVEAGSGDEREVLPRSDGAMEYIDAAGPPSFYAMDGTLDYIDFDRPLDQAYSFRFRYRQRFALSDSVTTNWLLENYPDLYLSAALVEGSVFTDAPEKAAVFKLKLDEGIREVSSILNRSRSGVLTVDPGLFALPRAGTYRGIE